MIRTLRDTLFDSQRNYYYILIFIAVGLPLSAFAASIGLMLLLINWILSARFHLKFQILKERKSPLIISSVYFLYLICLVFTNDFRNDFYSVLLKLPVLLLPLILGSTESLSPKKVMYLLLLFSFSVVASSLSSIIIYGKEFAINAQSLNSFSQYLSGPHLPFMANFAMCCLFFYGFGGDLKSLKNVKFQILLINAAIWLIAFLYITKSLSGLTIFLFLVLYMGWKYSSKIELIAPMFIVRILIVSIPLIIASWLSHSIGSYYYRDKLDFSDLESETLSGNPYVHDTNSKQTENGHYVWVNICEAELREEWNKRSMLDYDGKDSLSNNLRITLIRYLTSKDFTKDARGINELTQVDIFAIENGITNHIFLDRYSLYPIIYKNLQIHENYKQGEIPDDNSIIGQILLLKAGLHVVKENFLFGSGFSGLKSDPNVNINEASSRLSTNSGSRVHNQFLTFLMTFGIIGFLICLAGFLIPVFIEQRWVEYLFLCFALIGFLSFLIEDILESQNGISFFMFFYSLLLFGRSRIIPKE